MAPHIIIMLTSQQPSAPKGPCIFYGDLVTERENVNIRLFLMEHLPPLRRNALKTECLLVPLHQPVLPPLCLCVCVCVFIALRHQA